MVSRSLHRKLAAGVALVFLLGAITGAALMRAYEDNRLLRIIDQGPLAARREVVLVELEKRLDLSPAQREVLANALDAQVVENATALRLLLLPLLRAHWDSIAQKLQPTLSEEQNQALRAWIQERQDAVENIIPAP